MTKKYNYKKKTGRPSKFDLVNKGIVFNLQDIKRCMCLGLTDEQLCAVLNITTQTLYNWRRDYPDFFDSLKEWRKTADGRVERSLYERACGYTHEEEQIFQYQGQVVRAKTIKHYAPDVTACIFWLKNRNPEQWRDKIDVEGGDTHITNIIDSFNRNSGRLDEEAKEGISKRVGLLEEALSEG